MNPQILTLFGEEYAPEQIKAVGKSRAKAKAPKKGKPAEEPEETGEVRAKQPRARRKPAEPLKKDILDGWVPEKQYYSIGEVAALFSVNTSHIRFWTNEFALKVRTTRKGDRLFTPVQIRELRAIYYLVKEKGFTLSGARAKLKEEKKTAVEAIDLKQALLKLRNQLTSIRNQLN
jgi:DNA-binding transcriptional MerR regulator